MSDEAFALGLSTDADPERAAAEAAAQAAQGLGGLSATLVIVFATPDLAIEGGLLLPALREILSPTVLLGSMGEAVIAGGREFEEGPALAVWAAHLPGAHLIPFRLVARSDGDATAVSGWPADATGGTAPRGPVILLADPFTFPVDAFLGEVNAAEDDAWVVGGMASGGRRPGAHRLYYQDAVLDEGAIGVILGRVDVAPVVSQGCEPVGPEMVVTAGTGQVVEELAGAPAVAKLEEVLAELEPAERELARRGLFAGLVINENQPDYERGDFLIRGIQGGDRDTGALVVGEQVRVGQTMRFHVRDAISADEDLRQALVRAREAGAPAHPAGALVFSCNGRGTHMFPEPDHDAIVVNDELGNIPVAGMFCNGEIGPVGGKSFVHGFTATIGLFTSRTAP